jgi:hypothetical protein
MAHVKPGVFWAPVCPAGVQINMPDQPASDPQFWRNLAGIARAKADQTLDDVTKQLLLRIAEAHDRVAELVEQRSRHAEKSK